MIEYHDDKLGKVKVLNVTEARANFASVLKDADFHYIITKNNRPIRIIVDFEEFERLTSDVQGVESDYEPTNDFTKKLTGGKKAKNRVPGLLNKSYELTKKHEEEKAKEKKVHKPVTEDPYSPKALRERLLNQEQPVVEQVEDETSLHIHSPSENDIWSEDSDQLEEITINELLQEPPQDVAGDGPQVEELPSSSQEEYFKKYQKLYSSNMADDPEPVGGTLPHESSQLEEELLKKFSRPVDHAPPPPPRRKVSPSHSRTQKDEHEIQVKTEELPPLSVQQEIKPEERVEVQEKASPKEAPGPQDDLPSLKDLLKDLEGETLSGDLGEGRDDLGDDEINDIIKRLTDDI